MIKETSGFPCGRAHRVAGAIAVLLLFVAIAVPNLKAPRSMPNPWGCRGNLKTLAGSLELYELDSGRLVGEMTPAFLEEVLQEQGYLQSVPQDPGSGESPGVGYYLMPRVSGGTPEVACRIHGTAEDIDRSHPKRPIGSFLRKLRACL